MELKDESILKHLNHGDHGHDDQQYTYHGTMTASGIDWSSKFQWLQPHQAEGHVHMPSWLII